jgi:CheY-like chemotaxis protein
MSEEPRVLIIDDDPAFAMATTMLLQEAGYKASWAKNADEGLAAMQKEQPDLVLLDIMMDWVLDGVHVSREMSRIPELRDIPVIMVTSIADSEYRGAFPQDEYLHIDSWLFKPVDPARLISEVNRLAKKKEAHA